MYKQQILLVIIGEARRVLWVGRWSWRGRVSSSSSDSQIVLREIVG